MITLILLRAVTERRKKMKKKLFTMLHLFTRFHFAIADVCSKKICIFCVCLLLLPAYRWIENLVLMEKAEQWNEIEKLITFYYYIELIARMKQTHKRYIERSVVVHFAIFIFYGSYMSFCFCFLLRMIWKKKKNNL